MGPQLDVLVIESQHGAGRDAARDLEGAGHRIVRCFGEHDSGFPCRGIADAGGCPVERPVDATIAVRHALAVRAQSAVRRMRGPRAGVGISVVGPGGSTA
jgi:hypothetical protein